ncbi:hypothetical protein K3758_05790 [Sulfitobacter sp. W002]|jgi:hypothetical protein|uniref:hypothetical protein n=1 Tax=Sulfitobacter sp. W002 TaxID=2867024 RepID=UPI0021A65A90|nr:hypothetical protein [Sulfitobacter sp. W002]UWR31033.1 hypothetical protein K3758_05790 [Sulfitobacter sp. W002]
MAPCDHDTPAFRDGQANRAQLTGPNRTRTDAQPRHLAPGALAFAPHADHI